MNIVNPMVAQSLRQNQLNYQRALERQKQVLQRSEQHQRQQQELQAQMQKNVIGTNPMDADTSSNNTTASLTNATGLPTVDKNGNIVNNGMNTESLESNTTATTTTTGAALGTSTSNGAGSSNTKEGNGADWRESGVQLYVGKLCAPITDSFFKTLLNACGTVKEWKRMKDTFGFVTFEDPEGAMRCLKLLNGKVLYSTEILV